MRDGAIVQTMAMLLVTWMSIISMPRSDGNLLRLALPKDTFIIPDDNFDASRSSSPFARRLVMVRRPQVLPTKAMFQHRLNVPQPQPTPQNQFFSSQTNIDRPKRHPNCGVKPDPGECRGAFPRYYYNSKTDQCDCFLYGGCGDAGLEYSFRNLEECQQSCVPSNMEEGPVCKKVFGDDEVFFDSVTNPPRPIPSPSQHLPKPDTSHLSDEHFLSLLMNSVNPENFVEYDDEDERRNVPRNRRF